MEGQSGRSAYRVLSGKIQIYTTRDSKRVVLAEIDPGDIFGEMAILQDRPRSASAVALERSEVEVLSDYDFNEMIISQPARLLPYLATFFERLRHANDLLKRHGISTGTVLDMPDPGRVPTVKVFVESGIPGLPLEPAVQVPKFPFRIGRALESGESATLFPNDLVVHDQPPYKASRSQCSLNRLGPQISVRDRGSERGTIVNGELIGDKAPSETSKPLVMGRNEIRLGGIDSPHLLVVVLS